MSWIYYIILILVVYNVSTSEYAKEIGVVKYATTYILAMFVWASALFLGTLIVGT